jgi:hypothetical protein
MNGSGVIAHTTSSASGSSTAHALRGAAGTATTIDPRVDPERLDRSAHGGAGGQPVVDQDRHPSGDVEGRAVVAVGVLLVVDRLALALGHRLDLLGLHCGRGEHVLVEHPDAAAR